MDVHEFRQACTQIWGTRYGVEAAGALGLSVRAVHNYGTGRRPVPASMPGRLKAAALRHRAVLDAVVAAMDDIIGAGPAPTPSASAEAAVEAPPVGRGEDADAWPDVDDTPALDAPDADAPEIEADPDAGLDPDAWEDDV